MIRILLIDDDVQVNEVMKTTLEILGYSVMAVNHPQKAAEAFATFQPDVTLVDYMLPGCSGLDVLRELGNSDPHAIRYLATGIADFNLLKQAMDAGASSLLSKPYRISDVIALMELAGLLAAAVRAEEMPQSFADRALCVTRQAGDNDDSLTLGQVVTFARRHGADDGVATRRLPLVAEALMKNAAAHGCVQNATSYDVKLKDMGDRFALTVYDNGPGFDWQKAMARARSYMDKPCASGLQLVLALAEVLRYEDQGRTARASVRKTMRDAG